MTGVSTIHAVLEGIIGHTCGGCDNPHGSILRLDIGPLGVSEDAPPGAQPHGWRHLTVLSPWRIEVGDVVLCDWNDEGGPTGVLPRLVEHLVGLTIINATSVSPAWDLAVQFSHDTRLVVFSDLADDRDDAWFILGTDGLEVGASPMRAEGGGLVVKHPPKHAKP